MQGEEGEQPAKLNRLCITPATQMKPLVTC